MEENIEIGLTKQELEEVLSKYFKTLEEIDKDNQEQQLLIDEQQKLIDEQTEQEALENNTWQELVLEKLDNLSYNSQFSNNIFYWGVVIALVIFINMIFYKFLKIFI